jgi:hypothetical protein
VRFISTSIISTDPFSQLVSREQAVAFDDVALAMDPFWFNGVEPGAFCGQKEGQDADPFARLLDLHVVLSDPGAHHFRDMPGSIIPDQKPVVFALLLQALTTPIEKLGGDGGNRATRDKAQPHLIPHGLIRKTLLPQHSITGQGFGVRIMLFPALFDEAHWMLKVLPGVHVGQGEARPPDLVEKAKRPIRPGMSISDQTITGRFFWRYIGSGLFIQCLARFQLTPKRASARRTEAPVVGTAVSPCETVICAASSKDQTLLSMPNSRGLRCKRSPKAGKLSSGMVVRSRCGRQDCFWSTARPASLKPLMTLRTVWSSQPTCLAMTLARSPRALARSIWQRRKTKVDDERNPAWMCSCSWSVKGRMKMGFIPSHIGPFPKFFRWTALGRKR